MTDLLAYIEDNSCHSIASPFLKRSGLCWLFKCDTIQKKIVITLFLRRTSRTTILNLIIMSSLFIQWPSMKNAILTF